MCAGTARCPRAQRAPCVWFAPARAGAGGCASSRPSLPRPPALSPLPPTPLGVVGSGLTAGLGEGRGLEGVGRRGGGGGVPSHQPVSPVSLPFHPLSPDTCPLHPHPAIFKSAPFLSPSRSPLRHSPLLHLSRNGRIVGNLQIVGNVQVSRNVSFLLKFAFSPPPLLHWNTLRSPPSESDKTHRVTIRGAGPTRVAPPLSPCPPALSIRTNARASTRGHARAGEHTPFTSSLRCLSPSPSPDRPQRRSAPCPSTPQQH